MRDRKEQHRRPERGSVGPPQAAALLGRKPLDQDDAEREGQRREAQLRFAAVNEQAAQRDQLQDQRRKQTPHRGGEQDG